jgi:hypothetical protein
MKDTAVKILRNSSLVKRKSEYLPAQGQLRSIFLGFEKNERQHLSTGINRGRLKKF